MTDKCKEREKLIKLLDLKKKDLTDTKKRFLQSIGKLDAELSFIQTMSNILEWAPDPVIKRSAQNDD